MAFNNKEVFDVVRALLKKHNPKWVTFTADEIKQLDDAILRGQGLKIPVIPTLPSTASTPKGFVLSKQSQDRLSGVLPKLRQVVELAIKYTRVDFRVQQGLRTIEEQREYVRKGTSQTMNSKHLRQKDGFAHAVDLVALVGGKVSWDFDEYYFIARAMDRAATELGVANHVRWGAAWDRVLSDFGNNTEDVVEVRKAYQKAVEDYKVRHKGKDFLDGPHFEWVP